MSSTPQQPKSIGKFSAASSSASPPIHVSIDTPGDGASGVRKALAPISPPVTTPAEVDRPPSTIVPAKSVNELQGQIGQLIAAFQSAEKRDPTVDDSGFWIAYDKLCHAYFESEKPGSMKGWDKA